MAFGIDRLTRLMIARFDALERKLDQMASSMADLDAALTAWETENDAAIAEVQAAVNDILNKIPPGVDTSAEVQRLQAGMAKQQAAADAVKQLDTTPTPAPGPAPGP